LERRGGRGDDGLDIGGVTAVGDHEGVLADLGWVQELLGARASHRPGVGLADDGRQPEPLEGALVGLALALVGGVESRVVDVEGVGVLHHELAGAQQAGPGTGSSRNLVWIWYSIVGRSLYEENRSFTARVNISSWVGASR